MERHIYFSGRTSGSSLRVLSLHRLNFDAKISLFIFYLGVPRTEYLLSFNKNKVEKEVEAIKKGEQKVYVYNSNSESDTLNFIEDKIAYHLEKDGTLKPEDILILGRIRPHYLDIKTKLKIKGVRFSTIHGAKGQESKIVFITELKNGAGGFPDTWLDDSIYQVIRKTDKDILLEEERRLFYVAITRAKDFLYLLSENGNQSQFIDELPGDLIESETPEF